MSEMCFYVAVDGHDGNPGTMERPFLSLRQAQRAVRALKYGNRWPTPTDGGVTVYVRGGRYSLSQPLVFTPEDSGVPGGPVRYCAYPGERVVLSGGLRVEATWEQHRDGVLKCRLSGPEFERREFDQLFVNGVRQTLARYPNAPLQAGRASSNSQSWSVNEGYLTALGGTNRRPDEELLFDPAGFKRWADPSTGILHAFQSHYWGNMQYRIRDVDWEQGRMRLGEGGFQLQRHFGINERSRYYVENVLEELDAPGEWFWDKTGGILYY
ncbi:MAG: peptide-binding protein, partial [Paenibacillaceae bacterium]|nr:peptide-binding protein [Paenibacillaceae bacterium]